MRLTSEKWSRRPHLARRRSCSSPHTHQTSGQPRWTQSRTSQTRARSSCATATLCVPPSPSSLSSSPLDVDSPRSSPPSSCPSIQFITRCTKPDKKGPSPFHLAHPLCRPLPTLTPSALPPLPPHAPQPLSHARRVRPDLPRSRHRLRHDGRHRLPRQAHPRAPTLVLHLLAPSHSLSLQLRADAPLSRSQIPINNILVGGA